MKVVSWKHFLKIVITLPFWLLAPVSERKKWEEYISGLIWHEHTYGPVPDEVINYTFDIVRFYRCKHVGCYMNHVEEERTERGKKLDKDIKKLKYG